MTHNADASHSHNNGLGVVNPRQSMVEPIGC